MEFESAHSNTTAKLPILKLAQENGTSVTKMSVPVTAEENTNKKNDVKARSLLLMDLPNEHQLTFRISLWTQDLVQIHEDDLEAMDLKWQLSLLCSRANDGTVRGHARKFSLMLLLLLGMINPRFGWSDMAAKNQGKPQQDDTGFVDSGCSRHMTGNITYLLDFKEFYGVVAEAMQEELLQFNFNRLELVDLLLEKRGHCNKWASS
ncbi:hypothetical protein Tco_0579162 [Tanacetum coccineum]